jgi:hypothetical protein
MSAVLAFLNGLAYGGTVAGVAMAGFVLVAIAVPGRPRADATQQARAANESQSLEAAP